jgi:plasmid stabilization system protein ParE
MAGAQRYGAAAAIVLVHPYLIFYRVNNGSVEIVGVLHGRRNLRQAIKNER